MKNKILKAGVFNTFGNFLVRGMILLTVPIFTNILTITEYGKVATFNAYFSMLIIFTGLNLKSAITNARFDFAKSYDEFISSTLFLATVITISFFILAVFFKNSLAVILSITVQEIYFLFAAAYSQYVLNLVISINIINFKFKQNLLISFLNTIGGIIISIILVLYVMPESKYYARILGIYSMGVLMAVYFFAKLMTKGGKLINTGYWKYALRIALPNILHVIGQTVMNQFDRLAIKNYINDSAVGLYSLGYNFGMIIQILWASINTVWTPWFFRKLDCKDFDSIKKVSEIYIFLFSGLTIIMVGVAPDAIRLLTPEAYWNASKVVAPLVLSGYFIFLYSFPTGLEFYYKKHNYIAIATTLAAMINILTNIWLIPIYGFQAAAWTTVLAYFFLFVFHFYIVVKVLKINIYSLKYFTRVVLWTTIGSFAMSYLDSLLVVKYVAILIVGSIISIRSYRYINIYLKKS